MSFRHSSTMGSISKRAALFFGLTFISTICLFSILAPYAFTWEADPVLTTGTFIREPHVTELREEINALRTAKDPLGLTLPPIAWTDDPIVAGSTLVRQIHFEEMQDALLEIYEGPWTTLLPEFGAINTNQAISLTDLQDLRLSVDTVGWVGDNICQHPPETCANSSDCRDNPCETWVLMPGYACGADCPAGGPSCGPNERCYSQMCGTPDNCQVYYSCQRFSDEVTQCNCGDNVCSAPYENLTECFADCGCGNSLINSGEQCDTANLNGQSCASRGFSGGTLGCSGGCSFDTSSCYSCGNLTCESGKGENGTNCPHDCCDANTTCGSQGRADGYNYCTGNISSPQNGSSAGYTFVPNATISGFCDSATEAYTSSYTCDGTTYRCCDPQAGTIAGKWSSGACGCNNNGVQDGDEAGVDCGGTHCGSCQVCNNGIIEGTEACDQNSVGCTTGGYAGTRTCNGSCTGYGACVTTQSCGDGSINGPEVCDGASLGGQTCVSEGYSGGSLGCQAGCAGLNTSGCFICGDVNCEYTEGENSANCPADCTDNCGNGNLDPGEVCDGANLAGQSCLSQATAGGTLTCVNCAFDKSGCNVCDASSCDTWNPLWPCQCDSFCTSAGDCCTNAPLAC